MPDEVKTVIGTLRAENGVPSVETAALVKDYVNRMRGIQAFIDNQGVSKSRHSNRPEKTECGRFEEYLFRT